jgi:hypothetical protein
MIEGANGGLREVTKTQRAAVFEETKRARVQSQQAVGHAKLKSRRPVYPDSTDESDDWDTEGDTELLRVIREAMEEDRYEADSSDQDQGN